VTAAFDTSITNHPQSATIINTINAAIAEYQGKISEPAVVKITFSRMYTGLGASSKTVWQVSYTNYINALRAKASSLDDATSLMYLPGPGPEPVYGGNLVYVSQALGRMLGLINPGVLASPAEPPVEVVSIVQPSPDDPNARPTNGAEVYRALNSARSAQPMAVQASTDGFISLYLDIMNLTTNPTTVPNYSLKATVEHEIDEVLGSGSLLNGVANGAALPAGPIQVQDLFRYDIAGNRGFTTSLTDSSYFSIDGSTRLARYNQNAGGDFSDFWSNVPRPRPVHVQDAYATQGTDPAMNVEWTMLDVMGWSYGAPGVWVDFNYPGGGANGQFATPYPTLASGVAAVPVGGQLFLKGNSLSHERPVITKPMSIYSVGGISTIGP
jgi:hypothetical protein